MVAAESPGGVGPAETALEELVFFCGPSRPTELYRHHQDCGNQAEEPTGAARARLVQQASPELRRRLRG